MSEETRNCQNPAEIYKALDVLGPVLIIQNLQKELTTTREKLAQAQIEISRLREACSAFTSAYECQPEYSDVLDLEDVYNQMWKALSTAPPTALKGKYKDILPSSEDFIQRKHEEAGQVPEVIMRVVKAAQAFEADPGIMHMSQTMRKLFKAVESLPEGF